MHRTWKLAAAAAPVALALGVPLTAGATDAYTPAPPCRTGDISYYYGGSSAGLGHRSFDITLVAEDGVRCRLSDRPLLTLSGPPTQTRAIPLTIGGRGGTLVLTPSAPLHTTVSWAVADTPGDTTRVSALRLGMPGGGTAYDEPFQYPGTSRIATVVGVHVSSWNTGIGGGQDDAPYFP